MWFTDFLEFLLKSPSEDSTVSSQVIALIITLVLLNLIVGGLLWVRCRQSRGNMQKVNTMHATLPEGMDSSSAQPSTSAAVFSQERLQTPGREPTPATDGLETEPVYGYAQPSTSAAVSSEGKPRRTTDMSPQTNPTATLLSLGVSPDEPTLQHELFQSLYEVGKKLEYDDHVHEGIRRSDGQKVAITFWERRRSSQRTSDFAVVVDNLLKLQMPPTCDHFMRLYDRFITEDHYILIMEHLPPAYVTLKEFIRRNGGTLTDETAKNLMSQLYAAIDSCMDKGVLLLIHKGLIQINTETLHIKLAEFGKRDCERIGREIASGELACMFMVSFLMKHTFKDVSGAETMLDEWKISFLPNAKNYFTTC